MLRKIKEQGLEKRINQIIMFITTIMIFLSIILFFLRIINLFSNVFGKEPEMLIICKNDNENLYLWENGISINQHDYCPKCGESLEETGIIIPLKCLSCNSCVNQKDEFCSSCGAMIENIKLKDWLNEKEYQTFKEYVKNYQNNIIKHILLLAILVLVCFFNIMFFCESNSIAQNCVKKNKNQ